MSLKEIKWCQHDPDSVDWNGDYTDALFMHFEKYIFLWKKKILLFMLHKIVNTGTRNHIE